jgi:hypothetical protein
LKKFCTDTNHLMKAPIVDFGLIFDGLAVTLLIVSRIEARESVMGSPDMVVSQ